MEVIFRVVAVMAFLGAALVLVMAREDAGTRRETAPGERSPRALLRAAITDLREALAIPELRGVVIFLFWLQFGIGITNPLMELFVRDISEGDTAVVARTTGALFSAMAVVNLFAMPWWGSYGDRTGHTRALMRCALLASAALAMHSVVSAIALLFVCRVLLGAGMAGASPCAYGLAAAELPLERRGGGMGLVFSARTLAISLSAFSGGWLSQWVGIRGLFLAGAALVLFTLFGLWRRRA